jgi:hypothetical protein
MRRLSGARLLTPGLIGPTLVKHCSDLRYSCAGRHSKVANCLLKLRSILPSVCAAVLVIAALVLGLWRWGSIRRSPEGLGPRF